MGRTDGEGDVPPEAEFAAAVEAAALEKFIGNVQHGPGETENAEDADRAGDDDGQI